MQSAGPRSPLIVSSNANPFTKEAIMTAAWEALAGPGSLLDAAERAVNVSELEPRDRSVGYGGAPNEEGFLQLDACVMSGADNNDAGAVAALENTKTPCSIARLVMECTDHLLLVGKGALKFGSMHGFKEENILTEEARRRHLQWKETPAHRVYYHAPDGGVKTGASLVLPTCYLVTDGIHIRLAHQEPKACC